MRIVTVSSFFFLVCSAFGAGLAAQEPGKQHLTAADYGRFESLGGAELSHGGAWLAYQVARVNDDDELRLRMLASDGEEVFPHATRPAFSEDDEWLAFLVGVSEEKRKKLEKAKKPVRYRLGLHSLVTGKTEEVEDVQSFAFSGDGKFLAMRRYPPEGRRRRSAASSNDEDGEDGEERGGRGVDLVVRDLESGIDTNFGNVGEFSWSDEGSLLAMTVDAEGKAGNGVRLFDPATGVLRTLVSAEAHYEGLRWREEAFDLAVFQVAEHDDDADDTLQVLAWRDADGAGVRFTRYDHLRAEGFDGDMRVVDFAGLRWSDDGEILFFGIAPWERKPDFEKEAAKNAKGDEESDEDEDEPAGEEPKGKQPSEEEDRTGKSKDADRDEPKPLKDTIEDPSNVEVWHARDIDIIPRQKRTESRDRRQSHLCALWLGREKLVRLGDDITEEVRLLEGQRRALGLDNTPYETEKRFGPTRYDAYVIDVETGEKHRFLQGVKYAFGSGPDGRYVVYLQDGDVCTYDTREDRHANLTEGLQDDFINDERNVLTDEPPPYGLAGWNADGSRLWLHSRYDVWSFAPDGSRRDRRTNGAGERMRHRLLDLDPEEDWIDPKQPLYVALYGDLTKQSGYGRLRGDGPVRRLILRDKAVSRLQKAERAPVFLFEEEAFDDSPDWMTAGPELEDPEQVTETNAFLEDYHWGRSELVEFVNARGEPMQGALFYPAHYEEEKRYPVITYIYELRSQGLHRFVTPSEKSPYNTAVFTTQGYFVFQPDITYRAQNPGVSALECVVPAIREIRKRDDVDPDGIGLVGHSWGAYQTAFLVTQTDLLTCGVAGAPLTNMMSMSMSIYWNSGQTDAWIFHESQGRMDRPFWRDLDTYIANSPIFHVEDMQPLLVAFGTEDGAVDFNQGVELYNAARLAEKQMVMLTYPGENHSLRREENRVDYHWRVRQWFDHYLKGAEPEAWITEGQKWLDRRREIEEMERQKKKREKAGDGKKPPRGSVNSR